jgi:hypothetical protein
LYFIAKTHAKLSAYQITRVIVLVFKIKFVVSSPKATRGLEPVSYRGVLLSTLAHATVCTASEIWCLKWRTSLSTGPARGFYEGRLGTLLLASGNVAGSFREHYSTSRVCIGDLLLGHSLRSGFGNREFL